jgi:hypothetical protein
VSIGKRNGQIHEWLEGNGDEVADGTDDGVLELTLKGASYDRVVASQVLLPKSAKEWPITWRQHYQNVTFICMGV